MKRRARAASGFSLIELLVAVIVVGALAAVAIVSMRGEPVSAATRRVATTLQEARRVAMTRGPVRADVAAELGTNARVRVDFDASGGRSTVQVFVADENAGPDYWVSISYDELRDEVEIYNVEPAVLSEPNGTMTGPTTASTKYYYADGTSDPYTLFFHPRGDSSHTGTEHARVYVLPLSGLPTYAEGW